MPIKIKFHSESICICKNDPDVVLVISSPQWQVGNLTTI